MVHELLASLLPRERKGLGQPLPGMVGGAGVEGPPGACLGGYVVSQTNLTPRAFSLTLVFCVVGCGATVQRW